MANALADWWQSAKDALNAAGQNMLAQQYARQNPQSVMPGVNMLLAKQALAQDPKAIFQSLTADSAMADPYVGGWIGPAAIKVWHGSPHTFNAWEAGKVGTGEGAAAYGYGEGGYHAEHPDVAMMYQPRDPAMEQQIMRRYSQAEKAQQYPAMQVYEDFLLHKTPDDVMAGINAAGYSPADLALAKRAHAIASKEYFSQRAGALYEENLRWPDASREAADPLGPQHFLNYDAPANKQPQVVQNMIRQALKDQGYLRPNDNGPRQLNSAVNEWAMEHGGMTHEQIPAMLNGKGGIFGSTPQEVSNKLLSAGVPGIRYLDAGSREIGKGTSNYVVFNPSFVEILSRNGIPVK